MRSWSASFFCLVVAVMAGCNTVGPRTVRGARLNYNEAIAQSRDEQLLLNLVRLRYRDTPLFLEISSVTTQYNLEYGVGASPGFSSGDTYGTSVFGGADFAATAAASVTRNAAQGANATKDHGTSESQNLQLDTSVGYYERPTVLYTPLQGQEFVKHMLVPLRLEALTLLSQSGWSIQRVLRLCAQEMNGLDNAVTAAGPTPATAPEWRDFDRAAQLLRELQLDHAIDLEMLRAEGAGPDGAVSMTLSILKNAETRDELQELRNLLRLAPDVNEFRIVPHRLRTGSSEVSIRTRSLLGAMYYLSQGVQPPEAHAERGWVTNTVDHTGTPYDWADMLGGLFEVRSSASRPAGAFVKTRYRGTWFYIDEADLNSKTTFGLLSYLFYLQAGSVEGLTPALTLSVGG